MYNPPTTACSLCKKPIEDILILTKVDMDVHSQYHREDGILEDMNGLRKQTREFFCENCFNLFVDKIDTFIKSKPQKA